MARPSRKPRHHLPPPWVENDATFFLTINCRPKGQNQLATPEIANRVFESFAHYHDQQKWFPELVLLMPDHLHALLAFSWDLGEGMPKLIQDWKRYLARTLGITWQRDYFDHRIRSQEDHVQTWSYIRENPVRAKLVTSYDLWPHIWRPDHGTGWQGRVSHASGDAPEDPAS